MSFLVRSGRLLGTLRATKGIHTSVVRHDDAVKKWVYRASGFCKYGLWHDDCWDDFNPDVIEAVRRLPQKLVDERNFRMLRAVQLNIQNSILPKEEWTKYEEDIRYLQPYLDEVIREREEREAWDKNY